MLTRGSKRTFLALAGAVVATVAIVAYWTGRSSAPWADDAIAATERPPAERLPFTWHDEPRAVPALAFEDAAGTPLTLEDFAGRVVLLNLWATWCAPCLVEMPALDALQGAAGGPAFTVVTLNQDRGAATVAAPFWQDRDFAHLSLYLDPGLAAGRAIAARGLPVTLLIDPRGRERARLEGIAEWDSEEVISYFRKLAVLTDMK